MPLLSLPQGPELALENAKSLPQPHGGRSWKLVNVLLDSGTPSF